MKHLKRSYNKVKDFLGRYRYLLLSLFFFFIFLYFITFFVINPNIANALVALGTLVLAVVTSLNILNSNEQEKRRRKETLLNEIIEWATDILVCGRDISRELFKELVKGSTSHRAAEMEVEAKFNVISWRGVYIRHISSNLNKVLYDKVLDTQRILRQHLKIMELDFMGKIKNASVLGKHRDTLDSSAKKIIEIAVSLLSNKTGSPS